MKILKNVTTTDLDLDMGIILVAGAVREINVQDYMLMASRRSLEQLDVLIDNGQIVVNDGTNDLSPEAGKAFIRFPDEAYRIKYDNSSSGLSAINVQDAIDEMNSASNVGNLTYGTLDRDLHVPNDKALVLVNPIIEDHEVIIEGELVCL